MSALFNYCHVKKKKSCKNLQLLQCNAENFQISMLQIQKGEILYSFTVLLHRINRKYNQI